MRYIAPLLVGIAVLLVACGGDGVTPDGAWSDCPTIVSADLEVGLHVLDAESCGLIRVYEGDGAYGMSWSPDGTYVAFLRHQGDRLPIEASGAESDLFLVRADGSQVLQLTDSPGVRKTGPVWSPDGSRLAYGIVTDRNPREGHDLIVYTVGNGSTATIAQDLPCLSYEWTSTGDDIVVSAGCHYRQQYVAVVDTDSGQTDIVPGVRSVLAVQPGGDLIAFRCDLPDTVNPFHMGLCIGRPDGSDISSPITRAAFPSRDAESHKLSDPIVALDAIWTRDGSELVFLTSTQRGRLFMLPADGGPGTTVDDWDYRSLYWAADDVIVTSSCCDPNALTSYRLDTGKSWEALIVECGGSGGVWSVDGSQLAMSTAQLEVCI